MLESAFPALLRTIPTPALPQLPVWGDLSFPPWISDPILLP